MSSRREQAVIEAPLEQVWACVGDPRRYPEWAGDILSVTGLATVEPDAEFGELAVSVGSYACCGVPGPVD